MGVVESSVCHSTQIHSTQTQDCFTFMGKTMKPKQFFKIFMKQIWKSATLLPQSGCASPAETKPGVRVLAGPPMNNRCQEEGRGARMCGPGSGQCEGRGGWRCMLITSGAGGPVLQVSVLQRTIDFGAGRAFLTPPAITKCFIWGRTAAPALSHEAEEWS